MSRLRNPFFLILLPLPLPLPPLPALGLPFRLVGAELMLAVGVSPCADAAEDEGARPVRLDAIDDGRRLSAAPAVAGGAAAGGGGATTLT